MVIVLVAGWFLWQGLQGDAGGASSPEDAVEQFQAAVEEEDLLGAINLIHPDEVGDLTDVVELVAAQVGDSGVIDVDDAGVPTALDVTVEDVDVSFDEVADGISRVTFDSGSIGLDVGDDALTFGFGGDVVSATGETSLDVSDYEGDVVLMVVEHDGRWYLSPVFTAAEMVLEANDLPSADLDEVEDFEGTGADSPEAAVEDLAEAMAEVDVEDSAELITGTEPGFANAYLDSFRELFGDDLEELQADSSVDLSEATAEVLEQDGDRARVAFDEFELSYYDEGDDEQVDVQLDGDCLDVDEEFDGSSTTCLDDYFDDSGTDPRFSELLPDEPYVVAVEEDGAWYVSATETAVDYLRNAAENLEPHHLESLGLSTPQPIELEDEVESTLPSSYATRVLTTEITEAGLYTVSIESPDGQPVEISLDGAGSGYAYAGGEDDGGGTEVFGAEEGQLTLIVRGDPYVEDPTEDEFPVTVSVGPAEVEGTVGLDEEVSGDLGDDLMALYEVEGISPDEPLGVQIDGPVDAVNFLDSSGFNITRAYPGDDPIDLFGEPVSYFVVEGFDEGSYSVTLTEGAGERALDELVVGDCVTLPDGESWDSATTFSVVDCFDAHDGQVFENVLTGGAVRQNQARRQCLASYDERVDPDVSDEWWIWWGSPGAPQTTCMLIEPNGFSLYGDALL